MGYNNQYIETHKLLTALILHLNKSIYYTFTCLKTSGLTSKERSVVSDLDLQYLLRPLCPNPLNYMYQRFLHHLSNGFVSELSRFCIRLCRLIWSFAVRIWPETAGLHGAVGGASDFRSIGCNFASQLDHIIFAEIDHEIISTAILPLLMIQKGQLVTGEVRALKPAQEKCEKVNRSAGQ